MSVNPPVVKNIRKRGISPLRILVHIVSWLPVPWLVWVFYFSPAYVDPVQYGERLTGQIAIVFLLASLACTPANTYLHFREAVNLRRPLGLYAFLYSSLHFLIYSGLDYIFNFNYLSVEVLSKPYLIVGLLSLIVLLPLAATSFKSSMKALGRNWRRLHSLIYPAAALVVLHYSWAKKGDLLTLSGEQLFPFLSALIVIVLLALRLPFVRHAFLRMKASPAGGRRSESAPEPVGSSRPGRTG